MWFEEVRNREAIEELEVEGLAQVASLARAVPKKLSRARRHDEKERPGRARFHLDRDRVLYSTSFRKLEYKTQVFVTHEGDLYRTRLTHTLEVMQISRTLAILLGLNETLAEAIALAHDIGHPPFGHGGEDALNRIMKDTGGFDHNLHGLRVVDELELCYPEFRGLNLCWETREGLARHTTPFDTPDRPDEFALYANPSAECQVVNIADIIAWCTHDLDDALRIGMISREWIEERAGKMRLIGELVARMDAAVEADSWGLGSNRDEVARKRGISGLINELFLDVARTSVENIKRSGVQTLEELREYDTPVITFSQDKLEQIRTLSQELLDTVYLNPLVSRMTFKGAHVLQELFDAFASEPEKLLPGPHRENLERYGTERTVCDYIAGMTDRYAMDMHDMLFQPNVRTSDWF